MITELTPSPTSVDGAVFRNMPIRQRIDWLIGSCSPPFRGISKSRILSGAQPLYRPAPNLRRRAQLHGWTCQPLGGH